MAFATGLTTPTLQRIAARAGLSGRAWFSQGLLWDEIYDMLQELALLDSKATVKVQGCDSSGQCPNAGWANRLMQSGQSHHETKSCGAHGGSGTPTVNTSLMGNLHAGVAVEMVRGLRGDHGCQTRARLFLTTGEPIQPHAEYEGLLPRMLTKFHMVMSERT